MNVREFQGWLNTHGAGVLVDGQFGDVTETATLKLFTNFDVPPIDDADIVAFATSLGVTSRHVRAVAAVECAGSGFDDLGRPKILFERHYFHRLTKGAFVGSDISNPTAGGYGKSSLQWGRLMRAMRLDPGAAFQSASWGMFQIMGAHWQTLGYPTPISMPWSLVQSEADHYASLVRFIQANSLRDEMKALSTNPETCRAFARRYNGPAYEKNRYHIKLAESMR